jgi:Spy/CpxP family protein refolding chaperone
MHFLPLLCSLLLLPQTPPQDTKPSAPQLREIDRIRLAEAFRLAEAVGDKIWPEWSKAPFAVLLVTPEWEYLIRHPQPSKDFTLLGEDKLLQSQVWYRKRTQRLELLATFPAVGMTPTIVIGQAESTQAKTSTRWVVTLLHEHFHQWQMANMRYYAEVDQLNLTRGDKTGMWMLNYPFPYGAEPVRQQFTTMAQALVAALKARGTPEFATKLEAFLQERRKFQGLLKPEDFKYASFQLWQEGIARYTEWHVANLAAQQYQPSKEFQALPDFVPFAQERERLLQGIEKELTAPKLEQRKRELFYPWGAAEGFLLDQAQPKWRERYLPEKFFLDRYYRATP